MTRAGGRTFRALRHRNYRLFFAGQSVSMVVNGVACAAVALWFLRQLPVLRTAIRPVYVKLGLVPAEE